MLPGWGCEQPPHQGDVSGRAIVPLVVQCPGHWLPAGLYTSHHQVHVSLVPKSMHQWGGFNLQGFPPQLPFSSVGHLTHLLQCTGVGHEPVWLSHAPCCFLICNKLTNIEDRWSRWALTSPHTLMFHHHAATRCLARDLAAPSTPDVSGATNSCHSTSSLVISWMATCNHCFALQ